MVAPLVGSWRRSRCYLSIVEILIPPPLKDPETGFGLQQTILDEVASGTRGPTCLMWSSTPYVAATRLETRLPGFAAATRTAESSGFPVLVRNSGGGAVAANEGSVSFSLTLPVEDLRHGLYERYATGVDLISVALGRLGVAAEGGTVAGEFCPGDYSVRSGGLNGVKHAGLAQRVTRRAARLEALILVERTSELLEVLTLFHAALGLPFRAGSVADLPATVDEAVAALSAGVTDRYGATAGHISADTLERAREQSGRWRVAVDRVTQP